MGGDFLPRRRLVFVPLVHAAAPEVEGVIATEQDPVVLGDAVVVELVGDIPYSLAFAPAD
ncbi:hypothetical protein D3C86_2021110 [compost metagenome]